MSAGMRTSERSKQAEAGRVVGSGAPHLGTAAPVLLLITVYSVSVLFLQPEGTP